MSCENISWLKLDNYIRTKNVTIIDLRSAEEFEKKHIKYAVNIPFDEMEQLIEDIRSFRNSKYNLRDKYNTNIDSHILERQRIIVTYCQRGSLSFIICAKLGSYGYNVKSLVGGINNYRGEFLINRNS